MNRVVLLVIFTLLGSAGLSRAADFSGIDAITKQLATLVKKGSNCEAQLNLHGKAAISGDACTYYSDSFHELWPDQKTMKNTVAGHTHPFMTGEVKCDEKCADMLQHVGQLQTAVIYFFDYIDFMNEME